MYTGCRISVDWCVELQLQQVHGAPEKELERRQRLSDLPSLSAFQPASGCGLQGNFANAD